MIAIRNVGLSQEFGVRAKFGMGEEYLVFAPNGSGKATFCSILRSLQTNDPAIALGRQTIGMANGPEVDFLFDDGNRRFQNGTWNSAEPEVEGVRGEEWPTIPR